MDSPIKKALQANLRAVEERIHNACTRAGRRRDEVTLVCVTKAVGNEVAAMLAELGYLDLGESRPQELWKKAAALPGSIRWHLLGHLQRNKVERTLPLTHLIHSVDSLRLLEALEKAPGKREQPVQALLEINASGEPQKGGFAAAGLPALLPQLGSFERVRIMGLMTMAALEENSENCRPTFAALRELRDRFKNDLRPPHHLSMGMSQDFEIAIEEGATLIRIGTALFEGIERFV